ncbi:MULTISPECIES: FAD-dependent oxidoreductase [Bradyrhizobium]|uniref:FAD-dependent oxidoreductase n=1 Tax=Bradyrhizobium TaxID=374 RepID=UPI0023EF1E1F|nr:FAD-dependent oxidoreductase [Bradyrhizobium zhengyangense]
MRKCEVAVLGLGLMGGAALGALLDAGVDALGFDPIAAGSDRGSSHGSCRIFRRFNFENPNYTSLSDEAHAGWIRLQAESGQTVLTETPILEAGRPGSAMVASSRAAAIATGRPDPKMTAAVANKEFPAFNLPDDWDVVVQDGAAILHTATVMKLMRARARDRVIPERASFTPHHDGVSIRTDTEEFFAERAILALGPWLGRALPQLTALLNVTRQAVGWFAPARPDTVVSGRFPIFILDRGPNDMVYGFPDFEQRGVKAAPHNHGPVVGPDDWGPQASDAELRPIGEALAALVPGAAGPIIDRDVCLYTNTAPADIRLDAGEEFIIDRWPESRLIVCSACSGHGAKFAPAIGQRLARLATDPSYEAEPFFQLSRYSQFA